jgi:hypothetical protein
LTSPNIPTSHGTQAKDRCINYEMKIEVDILSCSNLATEIGAKLENEWSQIRESFCMLVEGREVNLKDISCRDSRLHYKVTEGTQGIKVTKKLPFEQYT